MDTNLEVDIFGMDDDDDQDDDDGTVDTERIVAMDSDVAAHVMPELHCCGADSWRSQFSSQGYISTSFLSSDNFSNLYGKLGTLLDGLSDYGPHSEHVFEDPQFLEFLIDKAFLHMQRLVHKINEQQLGNNEKKPKETSNYEDRRAVTTMLYVLLHTELPYWPGIGRHVEHLRCLINDITSRQMLKRIYNAHAVQGNACESPAHHLMHGSLEWKFLLLCLLQKNDKDSPNFQAQMDRVFDDLIACAMLVYAKKSNTYEVLLSTPFVCTCVREIWLLLQLLTTSSFWTHFNSAMSRLEDFSADDIKLWEFHVWLMTSLSRVYGYTANGEYEGASCSRSQLPHAHNYEAYAVCVRNFLAANPKEEHLRFLIHLLQPVVLCHEQPRIEVPTLLWEFFNKRLDNNFFEMGASPSKLSVTCGTGRAYIKRYKMLFANMQQNLVAEVTPTYDATLNSYTLFILLLGKILALLEPHSAQKLLGRIYSKFSAQKFLQHNECGIHHTIELFLAMALCGNCNQQFPKLREKLLLISLDKVNATRQFAVTKGHMALILLHAEHGIAMDDYLTKFLHQLEIINYDVAVCHLLADCLMDFVQNFEFDNGAHKMIGKWLPTYLEKCSQSEQDRLLEAMHVFLIKIGHEIQKDGKKWSAVLEALNDHLLPFVKAQYPSCFSNWLPLIAANFCTSLANHNDNSKVLLLYFMETPILNATTVTQFMLHVLANVGDCQEHFITDLQIMQVWLKSLVLLGHANTDVQKLTHHVAQLDLFMKLTHACPIVDISGHNEPLTLFTSAVAKSYERSEQNYEQHCQMADDFNKLLQNFDKWLPAMTEVPLEQQPLKQYHRFYNFMATVIYNCPHIVYVKSKISCFFHVAFTRFILTTHIQMGKVPTMQFAQTIHKVWALLVVGVGKLNYKNDTYVQKTLNDLLLKWMPHFRISSNTKVVARPLIECLRQRDQDLALLICDKVASSFLKVERRQSQQQACLVSVIFEEFLNVAIEHETEHLETLIKGIGFHVLEHIMLLDDIAPSRNLLLKFVQRFCTCNMYENSTNLKHIFVEQLSLLTRKHLPYQTYFFFDLVKQLATMTPSTVAEIWETLMQEIASVELKRGVGRDERMRACAQQIERSLKLSKHLK